MGPRLCLGLILLPLVAAAADKEEKKETVEVAVVAILATDRNKDIDPKLECIARQVCKTHKELTGFQMGRMTRKSLAIGAKETFELIGKQKATVTVVRGADENNHVQLKIDPPGLGEITYDTCCGKFLPIATPYRTKNNDMLILAVCVRTCRGGK
jgi:hypothetical protein